MAERLRDLDLPRLSRAPARHPEAPGGGRRVAFVHELHAAGAFVH
jgi:hypothetical protein